ncbi:MAG: hypothetical protein QOF51_3194 [Chloroflexota bacterium]|nr:hypothetical protein [Chloroflexota bacterium]
MSAARAPRVLLLGLSFVLVSAACAGSPVASTSAASGAQPAAKPAAASPKRITVGIRGTAQVLSGRLNIGNAGLGVADLEVMVHAGMVVKDDQDQLHATLAEAIPTMPIRSLGPTG